MWITAALLVLLGQSPTPVVHQCDKPAVSAPVIAGEPYGIAFCTPEKFTDGTEVGVAYRLEVDGARQDGGRMYPLNDVESSKGEVFYVTPGATLAPVPAGDHTLTLTLIDETDPARPESPPATLRFTAVTGQPIDACAVPFGAEAANIFVTRWDLTTRVINSKMRVNFQLASKSPINSIKVRVDGVTVAVQGGFAADLTSSGGMWFSQPSIGVTHKLSVWVRNQAGCEREVFSPVDLFIR